MWAIPMDIAPRFSGSASGLMNTGSALAAIVSPLVFGHVIDKTGGLDASLSRHHRIAVDWCNASVLDETGRRTPWCRD